MTDDNEGLQANDLDDVRRLEDELRVAMLAGDAGALADLLDDRLVFTAPDGSLLSKSQDLAAHETGWLKLWVIDVTEVSSTKSTPWFSRPRGRICRDRSSAHPLPVPSSTRACGLDLRAGGASLPDTPAPSHPEPGRATAPSWVPHRAW